MIDRTSEFVFSPEVGAARLAGAPLVALESTLISHGLPHPDNIEVARGAGIPVGWFGVTVEAIRAYMEKGCTLVAAGVDTLLLSDSARRLLRDLR